MADQSNDQRHDGRPQGAGAGAQPGAGAAGAPDGAYRIGVTGHRVLGSEAQIARVRAECARIFAAALAEHPGQVVAISAIAEGADRLFANVALEMDIPLVAVLPFTAYETDFETEESIGEFRRLRDATLEITRLEFDERSDEAYLAGGKWIVDHSDLLVAIWDEQPARGLGGTAEIVAYAREMQKLVTVIHVNR